MSFRFSKPYAGDYRIGLIRDRTFPVALAVTASSAFPPFLSPVAIEMDPGAFQRVEGADLFDQVAYRERLLLTDGGAYDNLGLETVWNRYDTVLTSDAGAPFGLELDPETAWHSQVLRALDIATNQSRGLRKRVLVDEYTRGVAEGRVLGHRHRHHEVRPGRLPAGASEPHPGARRHADAGSTTSPMPSRDGSSTGDTPCVTPRCGDT